MNTVALFLFFASVCGLSASTEHVNFFVGGYGGGLYSLTLDTENGTLFGNGIHDVGPQPSSLHYIDNYLYVVNEVDNYPVNGAGGAGVFDVDNDGQIVSGNTISSKGQQPCHIGVETWFDTVFVSHCGSGEFNVFERFGDGNETSIGDIKFSSLGNGARAQGAFFGAHNRYIYVTVSHETDHDSIIRYYIEKDGTVVKTDITELPSDSKPGRMVFDTTRQYAYVLLEKANEILGFNVDAETANLEYFGSFPTLPDNFNGSSYASDIVIHPSNGFIYVTNRGADTISELAINADTGSLTLMRSESSGGFSPAALAIDPTGSFLVVCNQYSSAVDSFAIDQDSGSLTSVDRIVVTSASSIAFQVSCCIQWIQTKFSSFFKN